MDDAPAALSAVIGHVDDVAKPETPDERGLRALMFRLFRFLPTRWWSPKAWKTWASYIHWRLETYGVFYPGNRFNFKAFQQLLQQTPSYNRWLADFDGLRSSKAKSTNTLIIKRQ